MKKIFLSIIAISILAIPTLSFAQANTSKGNPTDSVSAAQNQLKASAESAGINTSATIDLQIAKIVKLILGFLGVIFLVLTIIAGFKWMTAAGEAAKVKEAQESMKNAIIGLGIILFSYLISNYVVFSLFEVLS